MILVDSNVPMYLVGAPHVHKVDAQRLLEQCLARQERLVTDAEVLQEILHRYIAIGRHDAVQPAFDALLGVVDEVLPIARDTVTRAHAIVRGQPGLSARDAVHVAVMEQHGVDTVLSFDRGFDQIPGLARLR